MSEVQPAPVDPGQSQAPWSEKYTDQAAFEKGFKEISNKLGTPINRPILGDGGIYDSPEAAWNGYKVFETALGKRSTPAAPKPAEPAPQPKPDAKPAEAPAALKIEDQPKPTSIESIDDVLTSAGLDPKSVADTFTKNGRLDDAAYQALAAKGFGRGVVDSFIAGQQAIAQAEQRSYEMAVQEAGGEQNLQSLIKWAVTGVERAEHAIFNQRLADPKLRVGAIKDLKARYAAASGTAGSKPLVSGQSTGQPTVPKSHAEYMKWVDEANAGKRPWSDFKAITPEIRAAWEQ